jgi:hypothetical protein
MTPVLHVGLLSDTIASSEPLISAFRVATRRIAMIEITLSDDQARIISESAPPFVIVDSKGRRLGQITPIEPVTETQPAISAEEWAEIKRRMAMPGPGFTTQQVLDHLSALEGK